MTQTQPTSPAIEQPAPGAPTYDAALQKTHMEEEAAKRFQAWMLKLMKLADAVRDAGAPQVEAAREALRKHAATAGARNQARFFGAAANDAGFNEDREKLAFQLFNATIEDGVSPLAAWLERSRLAFVTEPTLYSVHLLTGGHVGEFMARSRADALVQFRHSDSPHKHNRVQARPKGLKP